MLKGLHRNEDYGKKGCGVVTGDTDTFGEFTERGSEESHCW